MRFLPGASRRHSHGAPALPRAASASVQEPGFLFFFSFFCPNLSAWPCVSRLGTRGVASESPRPHRRAAPRGSQGCHEKELRWHTPCPCFKREEFMAWKHQRMTTSWLATSWKFNSRCQCRALPPDARWVRVERRRANAAVPELEHGRGWVLPAPVAAVWSWDGWGEPQGGSGPLEPPEASGKRGVIGKEEPSNPPRKNIILKCRMDPLKVCVRASRCQT